MLLKIAIRNITRNSRRTLMTASAIAIGAMALILLGEYRGMAIIGMETGTVQRSGHLSLFKKGYSDFGSGRPDGFSISGYHAVIGLIASDPVLKPMLNVVTPTVMLGGIAGNAALDRSKTFLGFGFLPSDRDKMRHWDEHRLYTTMRYAPYPLSDEVIDHGVVGQGLARALGLCTPAAIAGCPDTADAQAPTHRPLAALPRLELLSGASGAPNIVVFYVNRAQNQGVRELDDNYAGMHLSLAQQLLFGSSEHKVTSIILQLKRTEDIARARERIVALIAEHHLDLEVRDYKDLSSTLNQITSYLEMLFAFIAAVLGIVVLFTIANTMGMSVMERTNEVGTARAMGMRRSAIRRQFLLEGAVLGVAGASAGTIAAVALTCAINHAGITYHMPISSAPIPLYLMDEGTGGLLAIVWLFLVLIAIVASLIPANRAAQMKVVDALRHV